jgi:hypothetical protein
MNADPSPTPPPDDGGRAADRCERLLAVLRQGLAHDLPNHLIALEGLARLLEAEEGERLSAEGRDYVGRLAAAAARAHAVVASLAATAAEVVAAAKEATARKVESKT